MLRRLALPLVSVAVIVLALPGVASAAPEDFTVTVVDDHDDGTCDVDCTLREAINASNASPDASTISFDITDAPFGSVQTISPTSALPDVASPVTIDGYTEPGASANTLATGNDAVLLIELDGSGAGSGSHGLTITAGDSTVRGLVVNRFDASGIFLSENGGDLIEGNFLGTDATGTANMGNGSYGMQVFGVPDNTIGGTTPAARNLMSGNGFGGVAIGGSGATGNALEGNYIGTDAAGTAAIAGSGRGVSIGFAFDNVIGGTTAGAGNVISGNTDIGVFISSNAAGNRVQGNDIGTDATGTVAVPNFNGVYLQTGASNNVIGGTAGGAGNVISGNSLRGVVIANQTSTGNIVQGNLIGTDVTGSAGLGNGFQGVYIQSAPGNTVGGTSPAARNVISDSGGSGVLLELEGATGNTILGNYIGTDVTGTADLGNAGRGVNVNGVPGNTIGGTASGAGNVISGNDLDGVQLLGSGATGNTVQGNLIGTNAAGTGALANAQDGVRVDGAPNNVVGGAAAGARNVISANDVNGVHVLGGAAIGNVLRGNYIGTDATGSADLGNPGFGAFIEDESADNTIGGTSPGARNVISGNGGGVLIFGAGENAVQGNYIGTDAAGTADLGNANQGVLILNAADNTVGGTAAGAGNVVSGNDFGGVTISGNSSTGNVVQGNFIGTDATGTSNIGNTAWGVLLSVAPDNVVGGAAPGAGNVIAFNSGAGVVVSDAGPRGNQIRGNSLHSNEGLGIDLEPFGVNPNDPGDGDFGANDLQNFPDVSAASPSLGGTYVAGALDSSAGTTFDVDVYSSPSCDPSGNGEGGTYLGTFQVTTDGSGNAPFVHQLATPTALGNVVTATATAPDGSTSELSGCRTVTKPKSNLSITKEDDPNIVKAGQNVTYTLTIANDGPNAATGVGVVDELPPTAAFVSASASQGSCVGTTTVVCDLGTVLSGDTATVTIVARLTTAGRITNTASVDANEADPSQGDNTASATTVVTLNDDGCNVVGSAGRDFLVGTPGDDKICGLGGNDTLLGKKGNDEILGGDGDDTMKGAGGNDTLIGDAGNDTAIGGPGFDDVFGGVGADFLKIKDHVHGNDSADGGVDADHDVCKRDRRDTVVNCP